MADWVMVFSFCMTAWQRLCSAFGQRPWKSPRKSCFCVPAPPLGLEAQSKPLVPNPAWRPKNQPQGPLRPLWSIASGSKSYLFTYYLSRRMVHPNFSLVNKWFVRLNQNWGTDTRTSDEGSHVVHINTHKQLQYHKCVFFFNLSVMHQRTNRLRNGLMDGNFILLSC